MWRLRSCISSGPFYHSIPISHFHVPPFLLFLKRVALIMHNVIVLFSFAVRSKIYSYLVEICVVCMLMCEPRAFVFAHSSVWERGRVMSQCAVLTFALNFWGGQKKVNQASRFMSFYGEMQTKKRRYAATNNRYNTAFCSPGSLSRLT